ncbi:MAG: hypothetical protein JO324_01865 [Candidatus Eremiobacteraeota bacterium]|nr:hypothetical protein [Candidatus Eremiobacteraeota bacterium]
MVVARDEQRPLPAQLRGSAVAECHCPDREVVPRCRHPVTVGETLRHVHGAFKAGVCGLFVAARSLKNGVLREADRPRFGIGALQHAAGRLKERLRRFVPPQQN